MSSYLNIYLVPRSEKELEYSDFEKVLINID